MRKPTGKNLFSGLLVALAMACLACMITAPAFAQDDRPKPIERPGVLDTEDKITRFIMQVLQDKTKRPEPFVKSTTWGTEPKATYEVEEKPRPASGFGRYDVESLTLMAIWKDKEKSVAMMRAPDAKVFIVNIGDEAYDGRIVEISYEGRFVKFLQALKRTGPARAGQPDVKYVEKIVPFRR